MACQPFGLSGLMRLQGGQVPHFLENHSNLAYNKESSQFSGREGWSTPEKLSVPAFFPASLILQWSISLGLLTQAFISCFWPGNFNKCRGLTDSQIARRLGGDSSATRPCRRAISDCDYRRASESFSKVYASIHDLKPEGRVGLLRFLVINPGIGRHLERSLFTSPVLRSAHQRRTDTSATKGLAHKPAFDEANWLGRIASVGVRPQSHLKKANQAALFADRHEGLARQLAGRAALQFSQMIFE
jgi:hypothetical protein